MTANQKLTITAVAALVFGFVLGHYVIAPEGSAPPEKPPTRGWGDPPCASAPPMPPGEWPNVQCGAKSACQLMEEIWNLTRQAKATNKISPVLHDSIMMALDGIVTAPPDPAKNDWRCTQLDLAKQNALEGQWPQVFSILQDIPMGG